MILCRSLRNIPLDVNMQRAYGRTPLSARGYLGTHKASTMDMGKHVAKSLQVSMHPNHSTGQN